ncbi:MAG: SDR family oxidoreductase [Bacillati bacterium ANGP1]|uniref:SDR family oxidoreductase n=1 Tax=Candidatus Segetimicrobium genomatis TaxID=2569760 RepID=A0A537JUU7_9BACT|nr:MAG: SDR family oxidoreductase [Terrabacteria group bacterium ANGP1]
MTPDATLDSGELAGRVALVTGASRGIGRAIAAALAEAGAAIAIHCRSNAGLAKDVAAALSAEDRRAEVYLGDLGDIGACESLVESVRADFGRIDILVNNAGIVRVRSTETTSRSDWDDMLGVNLTAPFVLSQRALPIMKELGKGVIVNIASIAGVNGGNMGPAYAAAKGGLISLTRYLARDCARFGIRVNCVAPTLTDTDLLNEPGMDALRSRILAANPMGRLAAPSEVAAVVRFLCSDAAGFVNGDCIMVTGGP